MKVVKDDKRIFVEIKNPNKIRDLFKVGVFPIYYYSENIGQYTQIVGWEFLNSFLDKGIQLFILVGEFLEPTAEEIVEFLRETEDVFTLFAENKISNEEVIELWKRQKNN